MKKEFSAWDLIIYEDTQKTEIIIAQTFPIDISNLNIKINGKLVKAISQVLYEKISTLIFGYLNRHLNRENLEKIKTFILELLNSCEIKKTENDFEVQSEKLSFVIKDLKDYYILTYL